MKIQTPTIKNVTDTVIDGTTLAGGALASRGVVAMIPPQQQTLGKAGIAAASAVAASAISGKTGSSKIIKNTLLGMAVMQGIDFITTALQGAVTKSENPNIVNKFIEGVAGLNGVRSPFNAGLPRLMASSAGIDEVVINREFVPNTIEAEFEELPLM